MMDAATALEILRRHEDELRSAGIEALSIFGSVARQDTHPGSDIDIAVRMDPAAKYEGLAYIGRLDQLQERLESLLGTPVDLVTEPVRKPALGREIDRDRLVAFQ